jgi:hypothetical protein
MMSCFRPAWEIAFTLKHNMTWWRVEGMIPFARNALWRKLSEDELNSSSNSTTIGSLRWSSGDLPSASSLADPGALTPPLDPATISIDIAPLSLPPIPNAVLEVRDYMLSYKPTSTGILDVQAIVTHEIRLVEATRMFAVWMMTINVQEDDETRNMATRISSKDIYGHVGSATGDEVLAPAKGQG